MPQAAQATLALKKHVEEVEKLLESLEGDYDRDLSAITGNKLSLVSERVNKLLVSPTVESSPQLKPHVDFLVSRCAACQARLDSLSSAKSPDKMKLPPPTEQPPVEGDEQVQPDVSEEVKVEELAPKPMHHSSPSPAHVPPPVELPPRPTAASLKSRSHIVRPTSARPAAVGGLVQISPRNRSTSVEERRVVSPVSIPSDNNTRERTSGRSSLVNSSSNRVMIDEFDQMVTRVRRESLGLNSEDLDVFADTSPKKVAGEDAFDWKLEAERLAEKFESAKTLIINLREKTRRLEAANVQSVVIQKKLAKTTGKAEKLKTRSHLFEDRISFLNTRIVELDTAKKGQESGRVTIAPTFTPGERIWAKPSTSTVWLDATVVSQSGVDAYVVRIDDSRNRDEPKIMRPTQMYKVEIDNLEPLPFESEEESSDLDIVPIAKSTDGTGQPILPQKPSDSLLTSAKQNVKSLFSAKNAKKAKDKLNMVFTPSRASTIRLVPEELPEEIPEDAIALTELQRIYTSDLWTALMDPSSSETLAEVFFSTYEYHSTWEQVFATLCSVFSGAAGEEPANLELRSHVLHLISKWIHYSPNVLKLKATEGNYLKKFSFSDPASLGDHEDADSLHGRGKYIVGDYGTSQPSSTKIRELAGTAGRSSPGGLVPPIRTASITTNAGSSSAHKVPRSSAVSSASLTPTMGRSPPARSPRMRSRTADLSPSVSPRTPHSGVSPRGPSGVEEDLSSRLDEDMSDFSDEDDDTVVEGGEEHDSRTRREGEELYKSIGSMYKSLNMDTYSLQKAFRNQNEGDSGDQEDGGSSGGDSGSQLTFLEALLRWVEAQDLFNDKVTPSANQFTRDLNVWRRGPSRRKSRHIVAKKLVRQDGAQKHGNLLSSMREAATVDITTFSPVAVARQLFLEEWELFSAIKLSEFRRLRFMDVKTGHSFQYMVHRFNTWCSWIATEVLNCNMSVERANVISFFIEVAAECNKMHNFNSAYAVIGALNQPGVARLKHTWNHVPKKSMRTYNRVLAFWSTSQNMATYRSELRRVKPPAVPYLGLIGKDLFGIEHGSPTILSERNADEWILNFHKLRQLAAQYRFVAKLQDPAHAPDWEPNMDLATAISAVTPLNEEEAYARSQKLEPRGISATELYTREHPSSLALERSQSSALEKPLNLRADLTPFMAGTPALKEFAESENPEDSIEIIGCILMCMWKEPEFNTGGKVVKFSISSAVTYLVRELHLLEKANKFDVEAAETAKGIALHIIEDMRALGFILPASKWAGKLQGTLKLAGFQGISMKSDDKSVWSIEREELEKHGAKF